MNNNIEELSEEKESVVQRILCFVKKYWIYFSAGAIIVVLLIIILIAKSCNNDRKVNLAEETLGSVIAVETDGMSIEADISANELLVDEYPEINNLMKTYFDAKIACDVEGLSKIVLNTEAISEDKLKRESEYVEGYENIKCYTKKGLLDDTYIVYVYFEYKFYNIDTTAPAMIRMYVCTNESGDVYICNEAVDGEVASYMEEVNAGEDVIALFAETDNKLKEAINNDENLMGFYTKLVEGGGAEASTEAETVPETTEEATEEPTTEAVTEEQTESDNVLHDTDDTAFVKVDAKAYSEPVADTQYEVGRVSYGERYRRIGYNDNWSLIEYSDGTAAYVSNDNLIIDEEFIYVNETVYAKQTVRVRAEASYDAEVVGTLYEGESLKRLGYNDEWSKVVFNGDIYYIGKGFLTTNKPED